MLNTIKMSLSVLLIVSFICSNASADSMYGIFMVVKGQVSIDSAKGEKNSAKVGSKVYPGDTIISLADSRGKIVMSDRNVINISPDTKIQIAKYENDPASGSKNVEMNLLQGKVRNNVEQSYDGEKSKFLIKTPTAVAGVRGTQFLTGYNPKTQMTSITTFKGAVSLISVNVQGVPVGAPVLVKKGETSSAAPNKSPEAPRAVPKEEIKKMDVETASSTGSSSSSTREVASESSAPTMVDKKDMDIDMAKEIKDVRNNVVEVPAVATPKTPFVDNTSKVKDILRETAGKTRVNVRPQPVGK